MSHHRNGYANTKLMPPVRTSKHRVQQAFAPLIFRAHFRPERPLTPPPLPWHASFPAHGDGKPAEDAPLAETVDSAASGVSVLKVKRPPGEPGRTGERGFCVKKSLDLPEGTYEDLLVSLCCVTSWLCLTDGLFRRARFILLQRNI
jgi:hypothetical protein